MDGDHHEPLTLPAAALLGGQLDMAMQLQQQQLHHHHHAGSGGEHGMQHLGDDTLAAEHRAHALAYGTKAVAVSSNKPLTSKFRGVCW